MGLIEDFASLGDDERAILAAGYPENFLELAHIKDYFRRINGKLVRVKGGERKDTHAGPAESSFHLIDNRPKPKPFWDDPKSTHKDDKLHPAVAASLEQTQAHNRKAGEEIAAAKRAKEEAAVKRLADQKHAAEEAKRNPKPGPTGDEKLAAAKAAGVGRKDKVPLNEMQVGRAAGKGKDAPRVPSGAAKSALERDLEGPQDHEKNAKAMSDGELKNTVAAIHEHGLPMTPRRKAIMEEHKRRFGEKGKAPEESSKSTPAPDRRKNARDDRSRESLLARSSALKSKAARDHLYGR